MNDNRYAPPVSFVEDIGADERDLPGRSRTLILIGANAALVGLFCVLAGLFSTFSRIEQGSSIKGTVALGLSGVVAMGVAIGIFRHRRWAVITWCVMAGFWAMVSLFGVTIKRPAEFVIVGFVVVQFFVSLIGLWVTLSKSKPANAVESGIAQLH